jgi:hypothetical protein
MPSDDPPPMKVTPEHVEIVAGESARFYVEPREEVKWSISGPGKMNENGVYKAPLLISVSERVVVTATLKTAPVGTPKTASATVELSNRPTWLTAISVYLTVIFFGVGIVIWWKWPPSIPSPVDIIVGPVSVVLRDGESVQFVASERGVKWSDNAPNGLFVAPSAQPVPRPAPNPPPPPDRAAPAKTAQAVAASPSASLGVAAPDTPASTAPVEQKSEPPITIEALSADGRGPRAAATVWVGTHFLTVSPPLPTLHPKEVVKLSVQTDAKSPMWTGTYCEPDGTFKAPETINQESIVLVTVTTKEPSLSASVPVRLVPEPVDPKLSLWIAVLFGLLGGWLHATVSLTNFAGNKQFVSSWGLFYLARPFVGAALSLLVFLAVKGRIASDGVTVSDLYETAGLAALVGLFSDMSLQKLREIFEVTFGPKSDTRANKMQGGAAVGTPTILSVDPSPLTVQNVTPLQVVGKGFAKECVGRVDGQPRVTTVASDTRLSVTLLPQDVASARTLAVTLANPGGESSNAFSVEVAPAQRDLAANAGTPAIVRPAIADTDPPNLKVSQVQPQPLVVKGSGFVDGCEVRVGGQARPTQFTNSSQLTVTLQTADVSAPRALDLTVVNPAGTSSNVKNVVVKS